MYWKLVPGNVAMSWLSRRNHSRRKFIRWSPSQLTSLRAVFRTGITSQRHLRGTMIRAVSYPLQTGAASAHISTPQNLLPRTTVSINYSGWREEETSNDYTFFSRRKLLCCLNNKTFVSKVSANQNSCGDNFTSYGDNWHCCNDYSTIEIVTTTILVSWE